VSLFRTGSLIFLFIPWLGACQSKVKTPPAPPVPEALKPAYVSLASGFYGEALAKSEAVLKGSPTAEGSAEASYLKGYALTYGEYRFGEGRLALKNVVAQHAQHPLAPLAQKTLADTLYWQGLYERAVEEYSRLNALYGPAGWGAYALYQSGNCMLLLRKDGDALSFYRSAAEKYPDDPMADAALLRVAEVYRMLDDDLQAREELQNVLKHSRNEAVRALAMDELEAIEQAEETKKERIRKPPNEP
jgi:TolA-binding protein